MRFARLRLQGFKSFVDPTELVIGAGLTGVVGPNGCGKSNLLEALRWVMGESRAKAMRGDGMDDVIFAGTGGRPARASAQVSLVIEDPEGRAPPPYAGLGEIEVSRRITRDIGSAYQINGRTVRARDVAMLFADAASGAQSPALVRQGQIGELIAARPSARRRVIEDAAGIAGLAQRRHEAELKLRATEGNLERVGELVAGLEGRIATLSRQAAQARRYREIAEALRAAEARLAHARWAVAGAEARAAEAAEAAAMRTAARAEASAGEAARAREAAAEALVPIREEAGVAQALRERAAAAEAHLAGEVERARAAAEAAAARAAELAGDRDREAALAEEAEGALARLAEEERQIARAEAGHESRLAEAEAARQAAERAAAAAESLHDGAREAAALRAAEREAATARAAAAERALSAAADAARARATDRAEAEAAARDAEAAAGRARAEAEAAAGHLAERDGVHAAAERALVEAQGREGAARTLRSEAESAASALAAEAAGIERELARAAPDSPTLLDRLEVAPGLEAAVAAALGEDLGLGLAPEDGPSGWSEAATGGPAPLPEGAEPLAAAVRAPERLARRLAATGVVAAEAGDALQPRLTPGQRLVSAEGDLWRWDGFRRRAADAPSDAARRLRLVNRLAALAPDRAGAEEARAGAERAHREAEGARTAAEADAAAARKAVAAAREAEAAARRAAGKAEAEAEMRRGRGGLAAERACAAAETARSAEAEAEAARAALRDLPDEAEADAALAAARAEAGAARKALDEARKRSEEIATAHDRRTRRARAIAREADGWRKRAETAGDRLAGFDARIREAEAAARAAAAAPEEIAARLARARADREAAESRMETARAALAEAEAGLRRAEAEAREAERAAGAAREARSRAEAGREAAAARLAEIAEEIRAERGRAPEALPEAHGFEPPAPEEAEAAHAAAEAEAQKLRRQRDALGAVNLRAEADREDLAAERDALLAERADLEGAVERLRTGVRALNKEGRARLLAAFEAVNARFGELFRHLFGGGEARLVLVDSDDPLEAGLEILCQPPGKKLSTLSLLSGGEQTLTALSLIFAVFLCNPAPVCVLDEVDAPLDDANVMRFCALLDEMVRRTGTRFLIITHHAITMSRMDRLFGVTMVERGVSRLVSVDLAGAVAAAEPA